MGCGYNGHGELCNGNTTNLNTPQTLLKDIDIQKVSCGVYHTLILKSKKK